MELKNKCHKAIVRYLELKGAEILDDNYANDVIVFKDDEGIAFADMYVNYYDMSINKNSMKRDIFEEMIFKFFASNPNFSDVAVRYDIIGLHVLNEKRGIIRHNVNADLED